MKPDDLTNAEGLIVREMAVRAAAGDSRSFTGIAVPWDTPIDLYGDGSYVESFARGSVQDSDGAKVYYRHGEIIGHLAANRDADAGWEIDGLIADTSLGRDAYALLQSGSIDRLSVGFKPIEYRQEEDGTVVMTKVLVREVSLVPHPAYESAVITEVREQPAMKGTPMDTDTLTRADLQPLLDGQSEMERSLALIKAGQAPTPPAIVIPEFRNMGEFVRAVADGDEAALNFHKEFTDRAAPANVLADAIVKDSWLGEYIKLVEDRRKLVNTFGKQALPATGMKVEFGKLKSDTTAVGEQANEGDDLTGPGKVELEIDSANVHTVGGYTSWSFQSIQRATVPTVNTLWKAMMLKYAKGTETRFRTEYFALMDTLIGNQATNPDAALTLAADAEANDFLDLIIDASLIYEERGFVTEGLHASVDQFKRLNRLVDGNGNRLMNVYGNGMNMVGELNLKRADGSLANLPVSLVGTRSTTGRLAFYDSVALETLESPGAPFQLQDENIINLTKTASLYGYVAITTPFPDAILPVKLGA